MSNAIKVGFVDRSMGVVEFIVATASYLLAEDAAREALRASGTTRTTTPMSCWQMWKS
jgi:hypothetical protein